ncbi:MAG: tetratricopeptide repeat-containing glycosyltransferase [Flavobacterium sp.]
MIVKNESRIITRLFDSVLPIIDMYCICDTGSTDNTVEVIESYFREKKIPGKIIHEPFRNFCHNRTKALHACNGMSDYVLLLDADMILEIKQFDKASLSKADSFHILQGNESFHYQNMRIVRNNGLYSYTGVTHEYINVPKDNRLMAIRRDELFIRDIGDGGAKADKFERDIRLLLEGIQEEPDNVRYYFYLGNSFHDSGQFEKAIDYYKQRIQMGGWREEVWYSYYRIGLCYKHLGRFADALYYWLEGYQFYPERLEALYEIISHYRVESKHKLCFMFYQLAKRVLDQKMCRDNYLFLHNDVYTYKLDYEYTIFANYIGVRNIDNEVVTIFNHSQDDKLVSNLLSNMKFYKHILKPKGVFTMDDHVQKEVNGEMIPFWSSSSSMIPTAIGDGYICNVRYVNYYIDGNGSYKHCERHIITLNRMLTFDTHFNQTSEVWMNTGYDGRRYIGVEDVRLYYDPQMMVSPSRLLYIGTGYHASEQIGVVMGDIDGQCMSKVELRQPFKPTSCEKNWTFVKYRGKTRVLYQWFPLTICELPDYTNSNKSIQLLESRQMPRIFSRVRGSTCGFQYTPPSASSMELWFVVHLVSYESPRHYYHMIVVFDSDMRLLRYSAPFKFEGEPIEYCLSIVVEHERVLLNHSTWDRTTRIGIYDKSYIDSLLNYT